MQPQRGEPAVRRLAHQPACEERAPAATGRRRCGARQAGAKRRQPADRLPRRGERSEATSLTLRGERWTPDGTQNVTEPTERSEIASRRLPEGRRSREAGPEATRGALAAAPRYGRMRRHAHEPRTSPAVTPDSRTTLAPRPYLLAQPRGVRSLALRIGCRSLAPDIFISSGVGDELESGF